ncbi:MAG: transcription-repair coupling factor, partial [bacterium]
MVSSDLLSIYSRDPRCLEIITAIRQEERVRLRLRGMVGSAGAFVAAAVARQVKGVHLFVLPDRESAAYFFNDLEQIHGEKEVKPEKRQVLFFPSSFKRGIEAGIKDNQGLLSRTEILNLLSRKTARGLIVTYPEALSEKVVNKKYLEKNTLKLSVGEQVNMDFILDLLLEYEFERTDFVIEPGQFSLRGGLIDVYSFSSDRPYRIEFSGDKVATLRTFDPSSQLSIEKKEEISIVPDVRVNPAKKNPCEVILYFLPDNAYIWLDDVAFIADRMDKQPASEMVLPGSEFLRLLLDFTTLEFGKQVYFKTGRPVAFSTTPQPSFNKNFDLLMSDLRKNSADGYRNFLLTDNPKQAERLQSILNDLQDQSAEGSRQ